MRLSRDEFIRVLDKYKQMLYEEQNIMNELNINPEWAPGAWVNEYYEFIDKMCDFTEKDYTVEYGSDLDYFCWELDFGRMWQPGMVVEDGVDIKLDSAGALYDFIVSRQSQK